LQPGAETRSTLDSIKRTFQFLNHSSRTRNALLQHLEIKTADNHAMIHLRPYLFFDPTESQ
jgi:hypothetical protein